MTKILVTGSCGFIGSHLVRHIIAHTDWQIVGLDRIDFAGDLSRTAGLDPSRFAFAYHDLRAPIVGTTDRRIRSGSGRFDDRPFDFVAHLAAGSHVDRSVAEPLEFCDDNVRGTVILLDWLRGGGIACDGTTLYFSTDEVFGPSEEGGPFQPWDRFRPLNPYAAAKAGGEGFCHAYANCFGMNIMVTHGTNFFGPSQDAEKFIPLAVKRILAGEPVPVHTVAGEPCRRYYTHVENASSAVLHLLRRGDCLHPDAPEQGLYNITGEREVSNVDLVREIGRVLGVEPIIKLIENPPTRVRPDLAYWVDGGALEATGWTRKVRFEEGIRSTVEALSRPEIPNLVDCQPENDNRSRQHG